MYAGGRANGQSASLRSVLGVGVPQRAASAALGHAGGPGPELGVTTAVSARDRNGQWRALPRLDARRGLQLGSQRACCRWPREAPSWQLGACPADRGSRRTAAFGPEGIPRTGSRCAASYPARPPLGHRCLRLNRRSLSGVPGRAAPRIDTIRRIGPRPPPALHTRASPKAGLRPAGRGLTRSSPHPCVLQPRQQRRHLHRRRPPTPLPNQIPPSRPRHARPGGDRRLDSHPGT